MTIRIQNFGPSANYSVVGTNASVNVAVTQNAVGLGNPLTDLRIANRTVDDVFVQWGSGTQTAVSTTGFAVLGRTVEVVNVFNMPNNVAVLFGTTGGTVNLSMGEGS